MDGFPKPRKIIRDVGVGIGIGIIDIAVSTAADLLKLIKCILKFLDNFIPPITIPQSFLEAFLYSPTEIYIIQIKSSSWTLFIWVTDLTMNFTLVE